MSKGMTARVDTVSELFKNDATALLAVSHELKSPLALIRQLALFLESDDCSPEEYERLIHQIRLTSERALRLTSDITRSVRQDTLFTLEPLNPVNVCEEVAHELTPLFKAQQKRIEVANRTRQPLIVGNKDLLKRILMNFSDNALHYAMNNEAVQLNITTSRDTVRIGVRDYGPAVTTDVWRSLTTRLKAQSVQPVTARPQSSGLGLYIASQFANSMHGSVGATRHRDGATFYVDMMASKQLSFL